MVTSTASRTTEENEPTGDGPSPTAHHRQHPQQHTHRKRPPPTQPPTGPRKDVANESMENIRTRCVEEVKPIPSIYEEVVSKLRSDGWNNATEEMVKQLPTFQSRKKMLYNARLSQTPRLPKTIQDVTLEGKWTKTTTGEEFLLIDDGDQSRIITFASTDNLIDLCNAGTLFCDGTSPAQASSTRSTQYMPI